MKEESEVKVKKTVKYLAIPTVATAGTLAFGPLGGIAGAVIGDVLSRQLSVTQKNRITRLIELAVEKSKDFNRDQKSEQNPENYKELIEGSLLAAADSYEERKLPLLASLLAIAPHTNTPIESMNQVLIFAKQLSYFQLLIVGVIGKYQFDDDYDIEEYFSHNPSPKALALLDDVRYLKSLGIINQGRRTIHGTYSGEDPIGSKMSLSHIGITMYNGLNINSQESEKEWKEIKKVIISNRYRN